MKRGRAHHALTLPELLVSMGLSVSMLAGLLTASTAIQRGYMSAQYQLDCQQDQVLVLDFITRDLRRASSVTISNQNRQLALTLPDQLNLSAPGAATDVRAALRLPTIDKGNVRYGSTSVQVSYFTSGTAFIRRENGVDTVLSSNRFGVDGFSVTKDTVAGAAAQVSVQVSFVPTFSAKAGNAQRAVTELTAAVRLRNEAEVVVQ